MPVPDAAPAPDWGAGHYERTAQTLLPAAQLLVECARLTPRERVLDLGSGTGNVALLAAAAGADVTAVDPSPRLLSVAAAAAAGRRLTVSCAVGDAGAVPAPDGHFGCVLSSFGIIFAPDPGAAAREVARVLQPGGRALLTAWLPGGAIGDLAGLAQDLVRSALGAPPAPPGFAWHDEAAVGGLFSRHGATVSVVAADEVAFCDSSPETFLQVEERSHPLAVAGFAVLQRLGRAEQARQQLLQLLEDRNEDPGAFRTTSRYVVLRADKR